MTATPQDAILIALLDEAIRAVETVMQTAAVADDPLFVEQLTRAKNNFEDLRTAVQQGTKTKAPGAGLGITRAFSEWMVPDALYDAGYAVEEYYRDVWSRS